LRRACPGAEVLPETILDAQPKQRGDLILCSHVLYYIPQTEWLPTVVRMASWLAPAGALVLILQNHETDCMRMLEAFHGRRFDLRALAEEFERQHGGNFLAQRTLVPSRITSPDLKTAYIIAEFMLNLLPMTNPPARSALEEYLGKNFGITGGEFRLSCDQDMVVIQRRN
jgi:hypothetical protein